MNKAKYLLENCRRTLISTPLLRALGTNECIIYGELHKLWWNFNEAGKIQPNGSFYVTYADLYRMTGLGDRAQRSAIKSLEEKGLLEIELRGYPQSIRYFKFPEDTSPLEEQIEIGLDLMSQRTSRSGATQTTPSAKNNHPSAQIPRGLDADATPPAQKATQVISNKVLTKTIIKTSPPSAEEVETYEDRMKNWEESDTAKELYEGFLGVDVPVEPPKDHKPSKTLHKKIVAGEYERINTKDIMEYFRDKYIKKYKRYPNNPSDIKKTLGILKSGFLDKYGGRQAIEIIDKLLDSYDTLDLDRSKYPRPEYSSLTQDWLINKLLDKPSKVEEEEEEWVPSDWNKIDWNKSDLNKDL